MNRIPKKIHYCWFGKGKLPDEVLKCIKSWNIYLPEYEFKQWNEDNFDVNSNKYVKEAYEAKKFAFVTDYVRLYALYTEGGIYMDTDVEVTKPLDELLNHEAFSGYQTTNEIPTGTIGARAQNKWIKENLLAYNNISFIKEDGRYDMTPNISRITNISRKMGFIEGNVFHMIDNNVAIYPIDYFCAKDFKTGKISRTENTYTIHHFSGSWLPWTEKAKLKLRRFCGERIYILSKRLIKR